MNKARAIRKSVLRASAALVCAALPAAARPPEPAAVPDIRHISYAPDSEDFPNPERGFSKSGGSGAAALNAGMTLVHVYFRLDPYRNAPLPESFLQSVSDRFSEARASGVKLIPRFTYNFPNGDFDPRVDRDAPLDRVLQHVKQLAPLLRASSDVIAFMEAGFVGAWGEWHDSTSGLDRLAAKKAILMSLLNILPPSRDVVLRYERDKRAIFKRDLPITAGEAFSGAFIARVGHHNDCFLSSRDDRGTYATTSGRELKAEKDYLAADNRYLPQGGETCDAGVDAQPFIGCPNALSELRSQHWSQLNSDYHPAVLEKWRRDGCYREISTRLGYRLRLLDATYPALVRRGDLFRATIDLINDGFAAPYNPRDLQLVLHCRCGSVVRLKIPADPRRWAPGAPIVLKLALKLPANVRTGSYEAALALPDPDPRLRLRPSYSIRLANRNLWVASTGENRLNWQIAIR